MAETPEGQSAAAERGFFPHHSKDWDGSLFPLSSPSQPPDIRSWFSSYVYESPESLGLPDGVGSDVLLQEEDGETQYPMENFSGERRALDDVPENGKRKLDTLMLEENHYRANDDFSGDFGLLGAKKCLIKGSASSPERSGLRMNNKKQVPCQDHPIGFSSQDQEDENKADSRDSRRSSSSKSTLEGDLSGISQMLPMEQKDCSIGNMNTGNKQKPKVSLRKLLGAELLTSGAEENGNCLLSLSLDRCPSKDSPCIISAHLEGIMDSERISRRNWIRDGDVDCTNRGVEDARHHEEQLSLNKHFEEPKDASGFISIKNKERCRQEGHDLSVQSIPTVNLENLVPKAKKTSKETHESLGFKQRNGALKEDEQSIRENRSPLRDRTNCRTVEAAADIHGKWQCPRKAKAGEGPPMKQLRLDRWFYLLNCNSKIE